MQSSKISLLRVPQASSPGRGFEVINAQMSKHKYTVDFDGPHTSHIDKPL
jgi:hypothetical protein